MAAPETMVCKIVIYKDQCKYPFAWGRQLPDAMKYELEG